MMNLSDYINQSQTIEKEGMNHKLKIGLLASFTISGLKEVLEVECAKLGIAADIYVGGYKQYAQEILDGESGLYSHECDIVFLMIDKETIFGDQIFFNHRIDEVNRKNVADNIIGIHVSLIEGFLDRSSSRLIVFNLEHQGYSPDGILEEKTDFGIRELVLNFNRCLKKRFLSNGRVFIYDFMGFVSKYGSNHVFDPKIYYLGDYRVRPNALLILGKDLIRYVRAQIGLTVKCIVLDLDNTLWGGIIGEDGLDGIKLGPKAPGSAYVEFQKRLLALYERGILLAINSRNNLEDAMKAINEHPYMVLKGDVFSAIKINWRDKASNINDISKELNIGLDSLIFFDDDQANRELVRSIYPEVLIADLPIDPSGYAKYLSELTCFESFYITDDDLKRGLMYTQEKERGETISRYQNIGEFLKSLDIRVEIKSAGKNLVPRIWQLSQRTNQFNLTSKRYSEGEVEEFIENPDYFIIYAKVWDKFGDYGITSAVFVKKDCDSVWNIENFILSCRVIGKGVESAILSKIIELAEKEGVKSLNGYYYPSKRNKVCSSFFELNGFTQVDESRFEFIIN